MGFKQRKLLSRDEIHEDDQGYDRCVFCCDGCPDDFKNKNSWSNPPSPPSSNNHKPTILILMLCVLAVAFMFLVFLTIRRYRWNLRNTRRRNAQTVENANNSEGLIDENQGPVVDHPIWYIRTVGLQQSVIDSIAVFKYKKGSGLIEGIDCSVCLNEFQEDETLRLLPKCSHAFHLPCIDTWLRSHQNCPVCRAPIVVATGRPMTNLVLTNSSDLGSREEARVGSELGRRVVETDEAREMSGGDENEQPLQIEDGKLVLRPNVVNKKLRVSSDLVDNRVKLDEELQPVRRSMSMDFSFSSSSMVCNPMVDIQEKNDEGCSDKRNLDMNAKRSRNLSICRLIKSASFGRSLQKGPIPMKRSSSIASKHSRKYSASQHNLNFS